MMEIGKIEEEDIIDLDHNIEIITIKSILLSINIV